MAAPALTLKSYDTFPPVAMTGSDSNGAINLTGATLKFVAKGNQTSTIITGTCTLDTPASGTFHYTWGSTDTQTPDTYQLEIQITWGGGGIQKIPNAAANNPLIEIDADLNGALGLALCRECGEEASWHPGEHLPMQHPDRQPRQKVDEKGQPVFDINQQPVMEPGPAATMPPRIPGFWECPNHPGRPDLQIDYTLPEDLEEAA